MKKHIYILGTGLSHDGSTCLLKDGKICVAIEKERITRLKHEGGNDLQATNYCLDAEGITIHDVDLIVQNANFGSFKFGSDSYDGPRAFEESFGIPIITISHHLAHAYSTIGTCPFDDFNVLVMDGCGNAFEDCIDLADATIPDLNHIRQIPHLFFEKDSYYSFGKDGRKSLMKDFSEWGYYANHYTLHPNTTKHSIGGLYAAVSTYCFENFVDLGKLMGLAPYGRPGIFKEEIFELKEGRVFVRYDWMGKYRNPSRSYSDFKKNFQYYADIAYGVQKEVERAILYIVQSRLDMYPTDNLCYSGGTALNAVANAKVLAETGIRNIYMEPAAGDNGLALGCAFYGWLEVLKKERVRHNGSTCFGITYPNEKVREEIGIFEVMNEPVAMKRTVDYFFENLVQDHSALTGINANFRFDIGDYGISHLQINGSLQYRKTTEDKTIEEEPTCVVTATETDLAQTLLYPGKLRRMIQTGRIKVSNPRDLEWLLENLDMNSISSSIRNKITADNDGKWSKVKFRESDDYIKEAAALLADGKVIGWFQDGCEFGPRALGRRSILADPRNPEIRSFINTHIKFREDFRPFAPSVPLEDVSTYFETDRESPYMILVYKVREAYKDKIRSVVHEDDSCRIQTVTPDWNPKYYALLQEFKKLTGVSVLLNTSFNRKGMPIVETPQEALQFFFSCRLDHLVMDNLIIDK